MTGPYSVQAGRSILYHQTPIFIVKRDQMAPVEANAITHEIVKLLNRNKKSPAQIMAAYMKNETGGRRNMAGRSRAAKEPDLVAARELTFFLFNDFNHGPVGNQWRSIRKNLANKMAQGKYDHEKAIKLFMHLTESGARAYAKEVPGATWNSMFDVPTRREAAKKLVEHFEIGYKNGEWNNLLTKVSAKAKAANPNRAGGKRRTHRR